MPLTRKSKWQKHPKPTKEQGMHEERRKSWAELFDQLPKRGKIEYSVEQRKEFFKAIHKKKKRHEPTIPVRDAVKARDHNRCQVCGREATSLHHIRYRSQGGKNDVENLVCLCTEHHTGREGPHQSDAWRRHWEEWAAKKYPLYWGEVRERA